jgi:hypothetical protein
MGALTNEVKKKKPNNARPPYKNRNMIEKNEKNEKVAIFLPLLKLTRIGIR